MHGTYTARELRMQQYLEKARELVKQLQSWKIMQIPREENAEEDALANLASITEVTSEENSIVIHLFHSALDHDKHEYGIVHEGKKESQMLLWKAARYCLIRDNLYRKMFGGPLARCLGSNQTEIPLSKMEEDAENFVAKCDKCQRYANNMHRPTELLHTVISPWPFMKWGMDIVGPLPQAKGLKIMEFFQSWQIKRITSSPYHPVANGQVESTNKIIINNLKKRLEKSKGNWPEELPGVLWAYRTTTKTATGETLFSLVYGSEALIPVEIGEPSTRFTLAMEESNDEDLRTNLDLLEQRREAALIRMTSQKQTIERYYNRKAHLRYFKIGDFVLKKVFQSTKTAGEGKLNPNWE
uniref:Uncharacterized protein n=2 Tax=Nicotiana tabacum TaxID=4097 RepID=A0A1S4CMD4_TOBAC|nr:PREDICTED: uncharacterized protein LOC107820339 [Nicotiana tabacum]